MPLQPTAKGAAAERPVRPITKRVKKKGLKKLASIKDSVNKKNLAKELEQTQQDNLLSIEKEKKSLELLTFLSDQVLREQEIFWMRFASFAAVHAGALVLVTSKSLSNGREFIAAVIGIILGLAWLYVQWISLKYVDRPKDQYHWYRKHLGILWSYEREKQLKWFNLPAHIERLLQRTQILSSTNVGVLIPVGVTALWVVVAIGC